MSKTAWILVGVAVLVLSLLAAYFFLSGSLGVSSGFAALAGAVATSSIAKRTKQVQGQVDDAVGSIDAAKEELTSAPVSGKVGQVEREVEEAGSNVHELAPARKLELLSELHSKKDLNKENDRG